HGLQRGTTRECSESRATSPEATHQGDEDPHHAPQDQTQRKNEHLFRLDRRVRDADGPVLGKYPDIPMTDLHTLQELQTLLQRTQLRNERIIRLALQKNFKLRTNGLGSPQIQRTSIEGRRWIAGGKGLPHCSLRILQANRLRHLERLLEHRDPIFTPL